MLNNIKAAIFDMDGTLIDSMWVWSQVDKKYLAKYNLDVPKDLKEKIEHLTFEQAAIYFKNRFKLKDNVTKIMEDWNTLSLNEYKKIKLKPGAREYLLLLKSLNIKIALATSNCTLLLETALKSNNIYDLFEVISTTDEVSRGKNFPDIYLLTAQKLHVKPSECVVFEDILPAVKGAKTAGMKVIAVHDEFSENQKNEIIQNADKYIFNYDELTKCI